MTVPVVRLIRWKQHSRNRGPRPLTTAADRGWSAKCDERSAVADLPENYPAAASDRHRRQKFQRSARSGELPDALLSGTTDPTRAAWFPGAGWSNTRPGAI